MALGSVNMVSFVPKEIGALLGNTSVIPFTRAEIEALVNRKAYPEGKFVSSGEASFSYNKDGVLNFSDTVDYVKLICKSCPTDAMPYYNVPNGTKINRGGSYSTDTGSRYYCNISFSADGTLRFVGYYAASKNLTATYFVEGYHYY